jgi:hypothetical protein
MKAPSDRSSAALAAFAAALGITIGAAPRAAEAQAIGTTVAQNGATQQKIKVQAKGAAQYKIDAQKGAAQYKIDAQKGVVQAKGAVSSKGAAKPGELLPAKGAAQGKVMQQKGAVQNKTTVQQKGAVQAKLGHPQTGTPD